MISFQRGVSTPELTGKGAPPIHFSPEGSPLNRTYHQLIREAARHEALMDHEEKERSKRDLARAKSRQRKLPLASRGGHSSRNDGVESMHFATAILDRVATASAKATGASLERTLAGSDRAGPPSASSTGLVAGATDNSSSRPHSSRPPTSTPLARPVGLSSHLGQSGDAVLGGVPSPNSNALAGLSPKLLRRNNALVEALNDVQRVTLCFQEIIRHLSFHRVKTGRVLWKLQATYIQLFERVIFAFWQKEEKKEVKKASKSQRANQEMDLLRLQVLDQQSRLDAAEKTRNTYKDTIKAQGAKVRVLEKEVENLRAALVQEVAAAEEEAQERQREAEAIRVKVEADVAKSRIARKELFGGDGPNELEKAFTDSLGSMVDVIEGTDEQVESQAHLLSDLNALMSMQQVSLYQQRAHCVCLRAHGRWMIRYPR